MHTIFRAPRNRQPAHSGYWFSPVVFAATLLLLGCDAGDPLAAQAIDSPAAKSKPVVQTDTPATPPSYAERIQSALQQAERAKAVLTDQLSNATESGSTAASDSIEWATDTFNRLKDQGMTSASNTQEWLNQDWEKSGTWEYHVVPFGDADQAKQASMMNQLGQDRWECFDVYHTRNGQTTLYFKRPIRTYLDNIPMKDMLHLLPIMGAVGRGE